jgi:hypothetical protein
MTWIVVPIFRRTKKPRVVQVPARQVPARQVPARQVPARQVPARQVPARQVFTCTIRGVLARPRGGGRVDEAGPAAITLNSDGLLHLEREGQARRTIKIDQVAGLSCGDSSNDPEPAGTWISIDLKDDESWILIWIDSKARADKFCSAFETWAAQVGISTSRTV